MEYEFTLSVVTAAPIASISTTATPQNLPSVIVGTLNDVYRFLENHRELSRGHNVVLYHDGLHHIEVGVQVAEAFTGANGIQCSQTPSGLTVRTTHIGPYHRIPEAHRALQEWCRAHAHHSAGIDWEEYGDWTDDESQLSTTIYYLLEVR